MPVHSHMGMFLRSSDHRLEELFSAAKSRAFGVQHSLTQIPTEGSFMGLQMDACGVQMDEELKELCPKVFCAAHSVEILWISVALSSTD